jgi:hypothetical protein
MTDELEQKLIKVQDDAREQFGRYFCRPCADKGKVEGADERFCMGVYAGMMCDPCWADSGMNHDREFDPDYAGERMDEDY